VIYEGRIVGMVDAASADVNAIGLMMAGTDSAPGAGEVPA
jgi:hypothetical protein